MGSVVVTVVGPGTRADLSLPADAPVAGLLAGLVRTCAGDAVLSPDQWELRTEEGEPLPGDRTLADAAVPEGAVLLLQPRDWPAPGEPPLVPAAAGTTAPAAGDDLSPLTRGQLLLPERLGLSGRVGEALNAVVFGLPEPRRAALAPLDPAALTQRRRSGPVHRARTGWRRADYQRRLDHAITAPRLRRCVTIAVVSPTGGVGKTTVAALLGTLLAWLRRDRIVAVDANPDFGSLGRALVPDHQTFVDDLRSMLDLPGLTATGLDASLGRAAHGLLVLPAPTDPARMARLDEAAYAHVIERLETLAGVLVLDCGSGVQGPASRAAISACSQVVLVTDAEPAAASRAAEALRILQSAGRPVVLVINKMDGASQLDLRKLAAHVAAARAVVALPREPAAAARLAEGHFSWEEAPAGWRLAARELAAILAAQWPALGLTV